MRIKDQLVLREIAGQFVIVPIMERVKEVPAMIYISSSAAFLWNEVQGKDVTFDDMVNLIMNRYQKVTREQAENDIRSFLQVLERNHILEDGGAV